MSDTQSIVFLSESDDEDDEVREIPKDDDFDDEEEDEEKISVKDFVLPDKRGVDEGGIILQEESFVETKINQDECELTRHDMTTQTDDDFLQNETKKTDSPSTIQASSSGNRNITLTVSNTGVSSVNDRVDDNADRSRTSSVTSYSNHKGQRQNNSNVNTGSTTRYIVQNAWKQTRMYGNRVQPYNRSKPGVQQNSGQQNHPNQNFANNYNRFGIPSPNYNNFSRQILTVRERYIEQFKEYLCTSFAHFLNNSLPYNFPLGYNNNYSQGTSNNFPHCNNFPQGINNFPQGSSNFPQGINNLTQGNSNFPQGINNYRQRMHSFVQENNYPRNN